MQEACGRISLIVIIKGTYLGLRKQISVIVLCFLSLLGNPGDGLENSSKYT